ncbi:glucose-6-phosphate dehydrogenase [Candidatus Saccharibacteria bacterium]|nr:glucose-6-phosphate dehydrogenase [Candidatus Saccharibacteria bacterium]
MKHDDKPTIFVIFGITGDLAHRRLLPALYHLFKDDSLHDKTTILGLSRREITPDQLLEKVELCVLEKDNVCDPEVMARFRNALQMMQLNPTEPDDYGRLRERLDQIETVQGHCAHRLFYLSIPPAVYRNVVDNLGQQGLSSSCQHGDNKSSILVEKPFGFNLESAQQLISETNQFFDESQIYRIDHYLAKETAQNILTFRRSNPMFTSIWNSKHVSDIEVLTSETLDVKGRGAFYDEVGALRDQIQSHSMQLLALATLNIPDELDEASLHDAKRQLFSSIEPVNDVHRQVQRGQYKGYVQDVERDTSTTESYVSLSLHIHNERWQGTRIRLATGKKLARKSSMVRLTFKEPGNHDVKNMLTFRLQPNEGIDITLQAKRVGLEDATEPAWLNFDYSAAAHPDAYERVLIDAIRGDHMLFASSDEIIATWKVLQPVLDAWQAGSEDLIRYEPGEDLIS